MIDYPLCFESRAMVSCLLSRGALPRKKHFLSKLPCYQVKHHAALTATGTAHHHTRGFRNESCIMSISLRTLLAPKSGNVGRTSKKKAMLCSRVRSSTSPSALALFPHSSRVFALQPRLTAHRDRMPRIKPCHVLSAFF